MRTLAWISIALFGACGDDEAEIVGDGADGDADTDGDADGDTDPAIDGLDCQGSDCECSDGLDNDGDGTIDAEDVHCVAPYDDDESSWATGIPGDNEGSNADWECFFDGDSGPGNDEDCVSPNGCDCRGCCELDIDGDGLKELVLLQDACDYAPDGAAEGEDGGACPAGGSCDAGLNCVTAGDGSAFCSTCESCEWRTDGECEPNPCDEGEICVGDDPNESGACPDDQEPCTNHDDCSGGTFCVTGCCSIF
jgi:hypothetical protein